MLSKENISNFLDSNVNEKTFSLFSALYNLSNPELFRKVINLLYYQKINFFDLFNIPIIDNQAIIELIEKQDKFLTPTYNSGETKSYNIYSVITDNTIITNFFRSYNDYMNVVFNSPKDRIYNTNSYSIVNKNNTYRSENDFENTFIDKVVTSLLQEYSVGRVEDILPTLELSPLLPENEAQFIEAIKDKIFLEILPNFTNEKLSELFVLTNLHPAIIMDNYSLFTDLLNVQKFNNSSEIHFSVDLHNLTLRESLIHTQEEINILWNSLFNTVFDFSSSISDTLGFIKYKIAFISSLEEISSLPVNTILNTEFLKLYDFIEQYNLLHKKIDNLIISNLNIQVL